MHIVCLYKIHWTHNLGQPHMMQRNLMANPLAAMRNALSRGSNIY